MDANRKQRILRDAEAYLATQSEQALAEARARIQAATAPAPDNRPTFADLVRDIATPRWVVAFIDSIADKDPVKVAAILEVVALAAARAADDALAADAERFKTGF